MIWYFKLQKYLPFYNSFLNILNILSIMSLLLNERCVPWTSLHTNSMFDLFTVFSHAVSPQASSSIVRQFLRKGCF